MRHRQFPLIAASLLVALSCAGSAVHAASVAASNNATVQPAGPRTGTNGLRFLNVEGSAAGAFASWGVVDFTLTPSGSSNIGSLSLSFTEANAAFTAPGGLQFYLVSDTTSSMAAGTSTLIYNTSFSPDGLGNQLGVRYLLGTGTFSTTGNVNNGQVDTYSFMLDGTTSAKVDGIAASGGTLRFVVAPNDATVAATFAGYSNTTPPLLTLTSAVPEPSSAAAMLFGLLAMGLSVRNARKSSSTR